MSTKEPQLQPEHESSSRLREQRLQKLEKIKSKDKNLLAYDVCIDIGSCFNKKTKNKFNLIQEKYFSHLRKNF
jgi:hypothetical protein